MNDVLQTLAVLLTALLWGGLIVIDFFVTPLRFRVAGVDRASGQALGSALFRFFGLAQLPILGLVVILIVLGGGDATLLIPALFILALAGLGAGLLEPSLRALRKAGLSPEEIAANAPLHKQLHQAYLAADIFKIVLGAVLLVALVNVA
jgi:hypothetical protein